MLVLQAIQVRGVFIYTETRRIAHPALTMGFSQPSPCYSPLWVSPSAPPPDPPFLLIQNLPSKDITVSDIMKLMQNLSCKDITESDIMKLKDSWCIYASLVLKGLVVIGLPNWAIAEIQNTWTDIIMTYKLLTSPNGRSKASLFHAPFPQVSCLTRYS